MCGHGPKISRSRLSIFFFHRTNSPNPWRPDLKENEAVGAAIWQNHLSHFLVLSQFFFSIAFFQTKMVHRVFFLHSGFARPLLFQAVSNSGNTKHKTDQERNNTVGDWFGICHGCMDWMGWLVPSVCSKLARLFSFLHHFFIPRKRRIFEILVILVGAKCSFSKAKSFQQHLAREVPQSGPFPGELSLFEQLHGRVPAFSLRWL